MHSPGTLGRFTKIIVLHGIIATPKFGSLSGHQLAYLPEHLEAGIYQLSSTFCWTKMIIYFNHFVKPRPWICFTVCLALCISMCTCIGYYYSWACYIMSHEEYRTLLYSQSNHQVIAWGFLMFELQDILLRIDPSLCLPHAILRSLWQGYIPSFLMWVQPPTSWYKRSLGLRLWRCRMPLVLGLYMCCKWHLDHLFVYLQWIYRLAGGFRECLMPSLSCRCCCS